MFNTKKIYTIMLRIKTSALWLAIASIFAPSISAETFYGNTKTTVNQPEWVDNAVIYEVNLRQGSQERTLNGFRKELPRLKDLGVDILWLMPIHPISEKNRKGELGSYYAVADYKKVNPEFGTMDDLKSFVNDAHELGMKVIIDEVCNHTGCDNWWVESHPDYYATNDDGEMFGPFDWTDTYKLNYANPETRKAMIDALKFWVSEADIDGYRCDVAGEVPTDFWNEARIELDKIKPIFMLAESSKPELTISAFNADYNWPMKDVFNAIAATNEANQYAIDHKQNLPEKRASSIPELLYLQKKQYPQGAINMNMITNHDLNSWEGTEFDRLGPAVGAFAVLSYTLPGIPMMYTGQEVGYNHAFEFFKQDATPDYTANEFTTFYEMLNALKHNHPALNAGQRGGEIIILSADNSDVLSFVRSNGDDKVTVLVNLSDKEATPTFRHAAPNVLGMVDYFTGKKAKLPTKLAPWQYMIIVP
jgi:glycosidase